MSTAHSQLEAHAGSPIPDTHFAHQLTVLLHTRGRPFLLVHTRYKIGTFQQKPAKSHRWHNCGLQGSTYAHCTRAYLTSTVSAILASLLFLNTSQLPQAAITLLLQKLTTSTMENLFVIKKKSITANFKVPHATSNKPKSHISIPTSNIKPFSIMHISTDRKRCWNL